METTTQRIIAVTANIENQKDEIIANYCISRDYLAKMIKSAEELISNTWHGEDHLEILIELNEDLAHILAFHTSTTNK